VFKAGSFCERSTEARSNAGVTVSKYWRDGRSDDKNEPRSHGTFSFINPDTLRAVRVVKDHPGTYAAGKKPISKSVLLISRVRAHVALDHCA